MAGFVAKRLRVVLIERAAVGSEVVLRGFALSDCEIAVVVAAVYVVTLGGAGAAAEAAPD